MENPEVIITALRRSFHADILAAVLSVDANGIPSNADKSQRTSCGIATGILERIGPARSAPRLAGQTSGNQFEVACAAFIQVSLQSLLHLRPGTWTVEQITNRRSSGIAKCEQYAHLDALAKAAARDITLSASLGNDYSIVPDILVLREPESDDSINRTTPLVDASVARRTPLRAVNNPLPLLVASISCKWTLRSDRAQNARSEALNLIRNRKGRCPNIVAVTGEPSPSRLASLALGTGDIDCVYHFALPELVESVAALDSERSFQHARCAHRGQTHPRHCGFAAGSDYLKQIGRIATGSKFTA